LNLQKVLWTNIADLRLAEARRVQRRQVVKKAAAVVGIVAVLAALYLLRTLWH
jgi:hypothetical protein